MALKEYLYICSSCGGKHKMQLKLSEVPRSRYLLVCASASCKRRRRYFYLAVRPITGNYRG